MAQPSSGVVVIVSVSVVLYFQRAIIQYIDSSAGKQVRISIVAFSIRVGCEIRLKNAAIAVGIVFVAFKDCAIPPLYLVRQRRINISYIVSFDRAQGKSRLDSASPQNK